MEPEWTVDSGHEDTPTKTQKTLRVFFYWFLLRGTI